MPVTLEFEDSEISRVREYDGALLVEFSAAHVHGFQRTPDGASESGYAPSLVMTFEGAQWQGRLADCIGRLRAGRVIVDGIAQPRLALPSTVQCDIKAELQFANGTLLSVSGTGLNCRFGGEPRFVADLRC